MQQFIKAFLRYELCGYQLCNQIEDRIEHRLISVIIRDSVHVGCFTAKWSLQTVSLLRWCILLSVLLNLFACCHAAGSTSELKRELSAFDDKVTRMEHSLQQVCIFPSKSFNFVVTDHL